MRRWLALGAYTALVYGLLPYGPAMGLAVQASAVGRWMLGGGAAALVAAGAILLVVRLARRRAPAWAYAALAVAAIGYALALGWLRAVRLERVHLVEYGLAAWLAWRALVPRWTARPSTYVAAALGAAAIGWGDELLQAVTPGRVYDLRDVAANAVGASLGTLVLAVWHASHPRSPSQTAETREPVSPASSDR
jgi:mannose/fructose/N-acetylgalactosamine-specific phosphotransferase system component IIC